MKFKVGDKVECVTYPGVGSGLIGKIGRVEVVGNDAIYPYSVRMEGSLFVFNEKELKAYSPSEEESGDLKNSLVEVARDKQVGGDHYKKYKIQPSEFIRANNIGWYEANAIKRIVRHQDKNGREDIEKAIHELEFILEEYDEQGH